MFTDFNPLAVAESLPRVTTSRDEDAAASRITTHYAHDAADLTELLGALGLPNDTDTVSALVPFIPKPHDIDPADDPTNTTGEDPDMPNPTPASEQSKATATAEEAMAVSMYYADHHMEEIVEATGLTEQQIRGLVDAAEAEIDAVAMAAEGSTTSAIATATGLTEPKVTELVAAAVAAPAITKSPAATEAAAVVDANRDLVDVGTIAVLLAWTEQHDLASLRSRAARIRADLAELSDRYATERATAEAEARVAKAKADLEAAQAELRAVKTGTVRPSPAAVPVLALPAPAPVASLAPAPVADGKRSREELALIRAWARENGYQVGVAGIVKKTIVDAYDAAHQAPALAEAS